MTLDEFKAQFEPEIIEIAAVTGFDKMWCVKSWGTFWRAGIGLVAWQDLSSGEIHDEKINLVMGVKVKFLRKYLRKESVIKVKVQKNREGVHKEFHFVEKMGGGGNFPELEKILKRRREPVYYTDEVLGEFKLNRSFEQLETEIVWCGDTVSLYFEYDKTEELQACIEAARELFENQKEWDKRIREYAAEALTDLANDWSQDHEISEEEFKDRISHPSITIDSGNFTFWFDDDDIFLGHTVEIRGNTKSGPDFADIPG